MIEYLLKKEKLKLPKGYQSQDPIDGIGLVYENNHYVWRIFWTVEHPVSDQRHICLLLDADTGDVISRKETRVDRGDDIIGGFE